MATIYVAPPLCTDQCTFKNREEMRINSREILKKQPIGVWIMRYSSYKELIDNYIFRDNNGTIIDNEFIKCFYALDYLKITKTTRKIKHLLILESKSGFSLTQSHLDYMIPNTMYLDIGIVYQNLNTLIIAHGLDPDKKHTDIL